MGTENFRNSKLLGPSESVLFFWCFNKPYCRSAKLQYITDDVVLYCTDHCREMIAQSTWKCQNRFKQTPVPKQTPWFKAQEAPTPAKKDGRRPKMVYKSALFFERFPLRNFVQRIFFYEKDESFFKKKNKSRGVS